MAPDERFTFHSSRKRMPRVTPEQLKAMDADSDRCAVELSDARVDVLDYQAAEIPDDLDVAAHDPARLPGLARALEYSGADAVVLSACVQIPSLGVIEGAEQLLGKPVVSAAVCTAHQMLRALGLPAVAPGAGHLLSGAHA
ncbi:hypothetical protein ACIGQE_08600 [Streptomyces sp. NPDC053429]|uniref:hypothetical protein n=1 Tax=Streptomyces sp. NPDC053429 TaxID=3365702 RepID=UPI0037CF1DB2